jgi:hypothetical protein
MGSDSGGWSWQRWAEAGDDIDGEGAMQKRFLASFVFILLY